MTISLTKPAVGSTGWGAAVNQNFTDLEDYINNRRLPGGYLEGLILRYTSATALVATAGSCRDSVDIEDLSVSSDTQVAITTINGAGGLERKALSGTANVTSGFAAMDGTGTSYLTQFASNNTPRSLQGTIGTGGAFTTTITGTGTKFTSEVAIHDLIGNAAVGYSRVTAIASDTSLTVALGLTITNGSAGNLIENATVEIAGQTRRLNQITSDTLASVDAAWTGSASSQAIHTGSEVSSCWYAVWVAKGGSGTTVLLSTQRTRPFGSVSGYDAHWRRIGWVRNGNSGDFLEWGMAPTSRRVLYTGLGGGTFRVLAGGTTKLPSFTSISLGDLVPPTARLSLINTVLYRGTNFNGGDIYAMVRPRGSAITAPIVATWATSDSASGAGTSSNPHEVPCDGAQVVDYTIYDAANALPTAYMDVLGYEDNA